MRHTRLPLAALVISACALGPVDTPPASLEKEELLRTTLDNGLKVVLLEDHASPVVALNVWVRVGSADELEEEAGMAHVFEHMLFKGTKKRAVGEIAATVEAAGGNINAFTSFDMTVYHITMASRDVDVGIDVLADAVLHSTFDPAELAREGKLDPSLGSVTEKVVEKLLHRFRIGPQVHFATPERKTRGDLVSRHAERQIKGGARNTYTPEPAYRRSARGVL